MSEKELERRIDVLLTAIKKAQFFINYTKTELNALEKELHHEQP